MEYLLEPDDDEYSSISFDPTVPAAGLRITVFRPYPEPPLGMYLGDDGCATFETQFNVGHTVQYYPEALVGDPAGTTYNIRVKTFRSLQNAELNVSEPTAVLVPPIPDDAHIVNVIEPSFDTLMNGDPDYLNSILAIATSVLRRLHGMPGSLLVDGAELKLFRSTSPNGSLERPDGIRIGSDAGNEKFLIAHEMGHWLQSRRARQLSVAMEPDGYWPHNYSYDPVESPCQFASAAGDVSSDSHGIRSGEYSSGAMPEGFGHFVASVAFNTLPREDASAPEGVFRYYKEISLTLGTYDDFVDLEEDNYRVALEGGVSAMGGGSRWVELQCDGALPDVGDWDPPGQTTEVTSEIDWLRFFWAFLNEEVGSTSQPEFWDVVQLVSYSQEVHTWGSSSASPLWQNLINAVGDTGSGLDAYQNRMTPLMLENGVFNDDN